MNTLQLHIYKKKNEAAMENKISQRVRRNVVNSHFLLTFT
jgi:hypothetical protein